ncbi:MAG TPA: zinc ribbon domain-containing protein [Phycisphaerales bacterium]|nr:zinc ribbon domain-containing protein [Phycisphaerales bacterium]
MVHDSRDSYQGGLDDPIDPEGPSIEDLRRLDAVEIRCPACGHEVYDDTAICPYCHEVIFDPDRAGAGRNKAMWSLVGVIVLIVFVLTFVL